jgi:hypothetical protein
MDVALDYRIYQFLLLTHVAIQSLAHLIYKRFVLFELHVLVSVLLQAILKN